MCIFNNPSLVGAALDFNQTIQEQEMDLLVPAVVFDEVSTLLYQQQVDDLDFDILDADEDEDYLI